MENKVLVIASTFPRWKNDTTPRFVYELSNRLASTFKITVLAPHHKGAKEEEIMGKLRVRRFVYFKPESMQKLCYGGGMIPNMKKSLLARLQMPILLLSEFLTSNDIMKKNSVDLIHTHWILPQGLIGVLLKKIFKVPLLVTVHGSDLFPLKSSLFKNLQHNVIKNADFVTVNSRATKNELLRRFPMYSSKVQVIPMGVDTNLFKKRKVRKPKKYSKNKILLFVGRLSDQKGLQYLIDSINYITKSNDKIKLLIIGSGSYEKTLREKVRINNVEKYVEFLGPMPTHEIAKYHNFADVFVMPSLSTKTGTEALGLSLLESMSSGCAVVGTNVGGISFVIRNDNNGLLVKQKDSKALADAVVSILKNKKKSVKFGNNAASFVKKNYSWEKITKDFVKVYGDLL